MVYALYGTYDQNVENVEIVLYERLSSSDLDVTTRSSSMHTLTETLIVVQLYLRRPELGEKFGVIEIPVLKRRLPIYEGAEPAQLDLGVGHVASSVLPGENDNSVLAGHRGTSFRNFGLISLGDLIIITTQSGSFTYQTNEIRIVEIDDETVIVSTRSSILTLITCYPFNWIGPAPQRYIVTAVLIESVLNP